MNRKTLSFSLIISLAIYAVLILGINSCVSGSKENAAKSEKTGAINNEQLEGSISISGAFALYPLANVWAEEFRKEYPNIRFNISGGGAGKGMADVLAGATDLGMFSRDIKQEEKDQGVWWVSVTKDAVIPTISDQNPVLEQLKKEGLTREQLASYFLKEEKQKWKNSAYEVSVFTRSDAAGAAATWAKYLGGAEQEDLKGIAVYGDPGLAEAVKKEPNALGFNNVIYAYDLKTGNKYPGLEVIPIDVNENGKIDPEEDFYDNIGDITTAIADGRYPSPPARELYLISKGEPTDPAVRAFLNWVLDKGQQFIEENGYILLSEKVINAQKQKL
ncbi:Phosphate ABC transporter, periplasmic phosphate-binding protein PstS [Fulvivirga imtechensis AK7]|uniref:Phosphate ABC transporter, periplasmic phosphate-binding protein PstS n=1 Tax=Fulvivirga imtechensis AK7 TaxID=1237149 RepID=L8JX64_9BACT|nr:substrate-binding domain-containing protein [Fulvivirga imtechensis]ELR73375.1 Phosphate ABC transporter, periplasmic phosphate-binding protein PstS [Fulvivirga imtechensis AK7]